MQLRADKGHHKITPRKSDRGPRLGELHNILEFPFNIFATAEASDLKFVMQFGFSKAHYKITPREKSGPGLGKLPKIGGYPLIFLQRLKLATSRLAGRWALPAKAHNKNPTQKKSMRDHRLGELSKMLRFSFYISATAEASDFKFAVQLGLPKPIIKSHPEEKWAPWAKGAPHNWGFPF